MNDDGGPSGRVFWAGALVAALIVLYGIRGLFLNLRLTRIANLSLFLGASGIVHDFVWAPALVATALLTKRLPGWARRPARVAFAASATLSVFTLPLLAGPSTRVRNLSVAPLDYRRNLIVTIAIVWALATVTAARSYRAERSQPRP